MYYYYYSFFFNSFPGGSVSKESTCNAGKQETQVRSLGGEDPLEKVMTTHSSILSGESHRHRNLEVYSTWGRKR